MTTKKQQVKHQQQILFTESQADPLITKEQGNKFVADSAQQVLFENSEYLPEIIDDGETKELEQELLNHDIEDVEKSSMSWLWRIIISLFMVVVVVETVDFFITGFEQSPVLTSIYAIILSCLAMVSSAALWREFSGLRHFKLRQNVKHQASNILTSNDKEPCVNVETFCQTITNNLPCDLVFDQQQAWQDALAGSHSEKELLQLYSRVVLSKVDEKALSEVAKFSTEAVVLVGLSPVALIDMLIILSRNLRMINKVAGLYGLKLGYWSRIKLIKQVFVNMAYAGASEIIADFGSEMLGAELLGKLSTKFAQGLGAGMLTARLGVKTIQLCRPIPFDEKPKLTHIRKKIISQIKVLVSSNVNAK